MANDRIIIRCRTCKETFTMCKYYPSNFGVWFSDELANWIDQHMGCTVEKLGYPVDLENNRCFDLFTEGYHEPTK